MYILPTRAGVGFGLLLILMMVAGLNYANSLALFLTFLLAGFTLVTMHLCHRNLQGARFVAGDAAPTFAGREGTLAVILESRASIPRLRISVGVGDGPTLAADIPARGRARLELPVAAPRRGRVVLDRLYVTTTHPFGLFRTWTWVHAPLTMLVYPRARGTHSMPAFPGTKAGAKSMPVSGADEWLGLRPFRYGDSPRQVDWKAYAREAPLLIKEYAATGAELRMFDFNSLGHLELEARLEQLSRWIVDAEAQGEPYGLILPDGVIEANRGPEHRHRCLASLALFGPDTHGQDQST